MLWFLFIVKSLFSTILIVDAFAISLTDLKRFNDQINSLSLGELILEENLFAQLRDEFKKWNDHLNRTKTSCEYIFNLKKHV